MAQCAYCETETFMFDRGVPLCIQCAEKRDSKRKPPAKAQDIRTILFQDLLRTAACSSEAASEFDEGTGQVPSGLQHPESVQGIDNASIKLSVARKEMATALDRLNNYLRRGIVPEDLRQSG
jgi:hypothetical protein